jgi:hypothetical protein
VLLSSTADDMRIKSAGKRVSGMDDDPISHYASANVSKDENSRYLGKAFFRAVSFGSTGIHDSC